MFHNALLVAAIQADRRREFARTLRERELLDGKRRAAEATDRSTGSVESLSIGARQTGTSGPACEAL
jgi:hypothetical protein